MSDVTHILSQIESGDPAAADKLLPLVYDGLRKLAAARLAHEKPGKTLQATALVHEAYVRLVSNKQAIARDKDPIEKGDQSTKPWSLTPAFNSRGHFFAAAAEAMRRILVDRARRKGSVCHGGGLRRQDAAAAKLIEDGRLAEILKVDAALNELAAQDDSFTGIWAASVPVDRLRDRNIGTRNVPGSNQTGT